MYPKNWTFKGCIKDKCRLLANSSDPEYFNQSGMRLTTVKPGVFNKFSFQAENNYKEGTGIFYTIRRIELFGYTCDTEYECNGNLLLKTNCNNGVNTSVCKQFAARCTNPLRTGFPIPCKNPVNKW